MIYVIVRKSTLIRLNFSIFISPISSLGVDTKKFGPIGSAVFTFFGYKQTGKLKELTLCHKLWFSNPNLFGTQCRKPLIFQTYLFWSNKSHSLKFQRFTTLESKDIGIRKSEFVAKSQFLWDFSVAQFVQELQHFYFLNNQIIRFDKWYFHVISWSRDFM